MILSANAEEDIQWWIHSMDNACDCTITYNPNIVIYTDASPTTWGTIDEKLPSRG